VTIGPDSDLGELGLEIAKFRPHIIVSAASDAMTKLDGLIDKIELEWEPVSGGLSLPFYILSPYNAGDLGHLHDAINQNLKNAQNPEMYTRFIGLSIAGAEDISLQNAYATKLLSRFPDAYPDSANYYDAVYYLAYAMYGSSDDGALTGPGIADGMKRLLSGDAEFDVGSMSINDVFDALDVPGSTIHVRSTLGPPSFDPETGVRPVDAGVFCFHVEEGASSAQRRFDVLRYDRDLARFRGDEFPCLDGFYP
jgi:hypothetical protein